MFSFRSSLELVVVGFTLFCTVAVWAQTDEHQAFRAAGVDPIDAGVRTAVHAVKAAGICVPDRSRLCLGDGRFGVEVVWADFEENAGFGWVVPLQADDSGLFWFFDGSNWELLVKVLNGCALNGHFWVFSAATTNVQYTLSVTDHATGVVREYRNPLGLSAPAITDVTAFPTCGPILGRPQVFVFANPSTLDVGGSALITLIARDATGAPVGPGERIRLVADLGTIVGEVLTDGHGEAETVFTAGDQPGRARVTAFFADSEPSSVDLTIREPPDSELLIFASPSVVPVLGDSVITLIARDTEYFPLGAGVRIRLVADLGSAPTEVFTDDFGEAEARFTAGTRPGTAAVTAILPGSRPAEVQIAIRDAVDSLFLSANRSTIDRIESGDEVDLVAVVQNAMGEPLPGQAVSFTSQRGILDSNVGITNSRGEARIRLTVRADDVQDIPENGSFRVSATVFSQGGARSAAVTITVLGFP